MIENPYASECTLWALTPPEHRWIYNKIELGMRLGYPVGPVGMRVPAGVYCIRPIINLAGMASGGFRKVTMDVPGIIKGAPGHCWTVWSDEHRIYNTFIDDQLFTRQGTFHIEGSREHMAIRKDSWKLPSPLCGISRYMMVETLGGTVIDVGPRHMVDEMFPQVVRDYQQFDPSYEAPEYGSWGYQWSYDRQWDESLQAWTLTDPEYDL